MKLKIKFTLLVSILIAIFALTAFFAFSDYKKSIKETIAHQQFIMVSALADEIDSKLVTAQQDLIAVAKAAPLDIMQKPEKAQAFLDNRRILHRIFDNNVVLFTPSGKIFVESPYIAGRRGFDLSFREYITNTIKTKKPYISDPYVSTKSPKHPVVALTVPLFDSKGQITGILGGSFDLMSDNFLRRFSTVKIGETGYLYMIASDRTLIMHPDRKRILTKMAPGLNSLFDKAIAGFDGTDETTTSDGIRVLVSSKHLKVKDWILLANFPQAEAYPPIQVAERYLLIVSLIAIIAILFSIFLITKYFIRPLELFTRHLEDLPNKAEEDRLLNIKTNDEIGTLSLAFNKMVIEIDKRTALERSEELYRTVTEFATDFVYWRTPDNKIMYVSENCEKFSGYTEQELYASPDLLETIIHPEDRAVWAEHEHDIHNKGIIVDLELRMITKSGVIRWITHNCMPVYDKKGNYRGRRASNHDISERKETEAALRESEEKFRTLFNNSQIGMFRSRLDGSEVLDVNDKFLDIVGRTREETEGKPSVILWADPKERDELFRKLIADGHVAEFEYKMLHKQRGVRNCITSLVLYREHGILEGSILDITERKMAEAKLMRINRLLAVLSHVNRAIAESDNRAQLFEDICRIVVERGNFRMAWIGLVNRVTGYVDVASHFGYEEGYLSFLRVTTDSTVPGGKGPTGTAIRENRYVINNNTLKNAYMSSWRDAALERGYLSSAAFPIREHNKVIGALTFYISESDYFEKDEIELAQEIVDGISFALDSFDLKQRRKQDEEEKKRLEEQLHQSQKMESIGLLAGGVAHDFNNILSAIVSYGYMANQLLNNDKTAQGYIQEILDSANRAAELTHGLLAFSRKQVIRPVLADLNEIVVNISKMLRRTIGEDIEFITELSAGKLPVLVDLGQMEQVLMNLATNARDAMPAGGRMVIKTEEVHVDSRYAETHFFQKAETYAVLAVSDTGVGMDSNTQENIFEPFFTTKEVGKGTGLGLSMVYGIIKQHGGNIRVYSEEGKGTTFKIYLPMAEESRETIFEPKIEITSAGKGETIIVAEDEPQVRKSMRLILQGNGYKIIEAENGEDAVRKFKENRGAVSLILLDVIMPVKNGKEAYEEIRGIERTIKTIFMSGYTDDIITKKGLLEEGFDLISKPINPDTMLRKIRDVLDR